MTWICERCRAERGIDEVLTIGRLAEVVCGVCRGVVPGYDAHAVRHVPATAREKLEAWADGALLGLLYRGALWEVLPNPEDPPTLGELQALGAERYAKLLETIGRWRKGEVWALVLWEQAEQWGGGVYFSLARHGE